MYSPVEVWICEVNALSAPDGCSELDTAFAPYPFQKGFMSYEITPRPTKRAYDAITISSIESNVSDTSARSSPSKQIRLLEDESNNPVIFADFDDQKQEAEISAMQTVALDYADGIAILASPMEAELGFNDKRRLERLFVYSAIRTTFGRQPDVSELEDIIAAARDYDGARGDEDDWNDNVQLPLMKLALRTSKHQKRLRIEAVKHAPIVKGLRRATLSARQVDYVLALQADEPIKKAWNHLKPLFSAGKNWNHIAKLRDCPIAFPIETKGPMVSWTDGKPQAAIWIDAWLNRLRMLSDEFGSEFKPPPIPILIAQGHEWHFLVFHHDSEGVSTVREQIVVGSTRNYFDMLKLVAFWHWLMDRTIDVWLPWFHNMTRHASVWVAD